MQYRFNKYTVVTSPFEHTHIILYVTISHYFWVLLSPLTWWHPFWTAPKRHLFRYEFETFSRCHTKDIFYKMFLRCIWDYLRLVKDVFLEMYSRHLIDVSKKTSFLISIWDVSKMCQERRLFVDVSDRSLKCLSQWRPDWNVSETSPAGWERQLCIGKDRLNIG